MYRGVAVAQRRHIARGDVSSLRDIVQELLVGTHMCSKVHVDTKDGKVHCGPGEGAD